MEGESSPILQFDKARFDEHVLSFTETQAKVARAIENWVNDPKKTIMKVSGGPGTGKTFVVKKVLDCIDCEQVRMSFTAKSAASIGGRTIHSTLKLDYRGLLKDLRTELANEKSLAETIRRSRRLLNEFQFHGNPRVVFLEEASMVPGYLVYWIFLFFMYRTTDEALLIVFVGDAHQLLPVESLYNVFSISFDRCPWRFVSFSLTESKRFVPEYEIVINKLREYVDTENENGMFGYVCQHFPVVETIEGEFLKQADRAMAAKNTWVDSFNKYYIKNMVDGDEIIVNGDLVLKSGCIVFVIKNGYSSVPNGTELIFVRCKGEHALVCKKPGTGEYVDVRKDFSTGNFPLELGFAATVHKFQGETIDVAKIVIHLSGNRDLNLAYTALSRVRKMEQILAIVL